MIQIIKNSIALPYNAYKSSKDYSSTDELATHFSSVSQISATATNTDRLTASFTLRIERCNRFEEGETGSEVESVIFSPWSVDLTINPGQEISQNFTVRIADATAESLNCFIVLLDADFEVLDERSFNVTIEEVAAKEDIQTFETPMIGESETISVDGEIINSESTDGMDSCPECDGFGEILCIAWNNCWEQLIKSLGMLLAIFVLFYMVVFKCVPCKLVSCCVKCGVKGCSKCMKQSKKEELD